MTRGYRPVVAISGAKQKAGSLGFNCVIVESREKLPFDSAVDNPGCYSRVRVRMLEYSYYGIAEIIRFCVQEIRELIALPVPDGISSEFRPHPRVRIVSSKHMRRCP